MRPAAAPKIDKRRIDDLLYDLIKGIPQYFPDWKPPGVFPADIPANRGRILDLAEDPQDFGMAVLKLAARMGEIIIEQLNRVPEKNFLAFLDLLGIDLLSPRAARAPLTFFLAEKAPMDASVPKGTKVGVAKAEDVVFETEEDLVVARASLSRAYSLNPDQDQYADIRVLLAPAGAGTKAIFRPQSVSTWPLIEHVLYVGHSTLFARAAAAGVKVEITIGLASGNLGQLAWQYSSGDDGWKPDPPQTASGQPISIDVSGITEAKLRGYTNQGNPIEKSSYWIRAKTAQPLSLDSNGWPVVSSITAKVRIVEINLLPDLAFLNSQPIDVSKDFFPFGERPRFNDTFYIGSSKAFSKKNAQITINVSLSDTPPKPDTTNLKLIWEYWDVSDWSKLAEVTPAGIPLAATTDPFKFVDTTNAFTKDGFIKFQCPAINPAAINGQENYWIRIRIVAGGYGKEAEYQTTSSTLVTDQLTTLEPDATRRTNIVKMLQQQGLLDTARYVPATFKPPSLKSFTLDYDYTETVGQSGLTILTANDFFYREVGTVPFQPFLRSVEQWPALYLGFDSDTNKPVQGTPLSLFFQVVQPRYEQTQGSAVAAPAGLPPIVVWRYWDGQQWARLAVEDETHNFTEEGLVQFIGPSTLAEKALFGERLLWIRASVEAGAYAIAPTLQGILLNTVWAQHGVTLRDQVLGSSNGEPGQSFSFSKPPVLEGQVVEIRERALPSEAEQQQIIANEGPDAIRTIKDEAGNITEVWVRWHQVSTFSLSGPGDRHYVLDRITGRLAFGDGVRGLIPPPGKDTIKVAVYRSGGGKIGNCAPNTITELKTTFPFVDKVRNYEAAAGGSDQEDISRVSVTGPRLVKNRDRAVTAEDFEWLALQASGEVSKARCLPLTKASSMEAQKQEPGWITIIIVPQGEEDQPLPTQGLIRTVKDYLTARSLTTLAERIDVIGPRYVPVSVEAEVIPKRIEDAKAVENRVLDSIKLFLHPLRGGADGNGWEFGRDVYLSEIAAVIQGTEGVDRLRKLILWQGEQQVQDRVAIQNIDLPSSGDHDVVAVGS